MEKEIISIYQCYYDIVELLSQVKAPAIGATHPDGKRTSASEMSPTIIHLGLR